MCRAEHLSSSGVSRVQEEKLVSQALQGNGYPKGFIHKHLAHSLISGLQVTRWPVDLLLSPTSVDCPNLSEGSWPP